MHAAFQDINTYLDRPLTLLDKRRDKVALVVLSALISTIFIIIYNPLSVNDMVIQSWLGFTLPISLCGILGALTLLLSQFVLKPMIRLPNMKAKQFILWACFELFLISLVILFFYGESGPPLLTEYLITARFALIITIVPYMLSCLLIALFKKQNKDIRQTADSSQGKIIGFANLSDSSGKSQLIVQHQDLICLKAQDNYVQVTYRLNGSTDKMLIRSSMKSLEQKLPTEQFLRIHRSHLINKDYIRSVVRQNNKMAVIMNHTDDTPMPVSSTYQAALDRQFKRQISMA